MKIPRFVLLQDILVAWPDGKNDVLGKNSWIATGFCLVGTPAVCPPHSPRPPLDAIVYCSEI
jgi:hypothetical protein